MKTYLPKIITIIFFICLSTNNAQSSDTHPVGLTASFSGSQMDLLIPIRINSLITVSPGIGVASFGDSYSDLNLSISPKVYLTQSKVKPFLGARGAILKYIPKSGDSISDYLIGILGGGEYFIDEQFSFGIEAQINFSISDEKSIRFGNPDKTNVNTATVIFASVYF